VGGARVRGLIGRGRVADAALCLGRDYALETLVVKGEQRGRTIGVPTANLDLEPLSDHIFPADGVYAGLATLEDGASYPAAISVGIKPTFGTQQLTIETHLLGYSPLTPDELYGQPIKLTFARWLRDQYAFAGVDALKAQLTRDIDRTRQLVCGAEAQAANS